VRILVTNDDGVDAPGLHALAEALGAVGDVIVVAPVRNQTAMARAITLAGNVIVDEVALPSGREAFAVDGTPVDCVRFALLGLAGEPPQLVASGINLGANLGDDVTYSGTVAAAFEGLLAGLPAVAFSQQSRRGGTSDWRPDGRFDFGALASFAGRLVARVAERGLPAGTLLNVNAPGRAGEGCGVRATRLGRRTYRTTLELVERASGRRRYRLYDEDPSFHDEDGTDIGAIAAGCISVTPLHFDLTAHDALEDVESLGLGDLVG
jgi:5'-nucleotidase